jgi:hypothetical protein
MTWSFRKVNPQRPLRSAKGLNPANSSIRDFRILSPKTSLRPVGRDLLTTLLREKYPPQKIGFFLRQVLIKERQISGAAPEAGNPYGQAKNVGRN